MIDVVCIAESSTTMIDCIQQHRLKDRCLKKRLSNESRNTK